MNQRDEGSRRRFIKSNSKDVVLVDAIRYLVPPNVTPTQFVAIATFCQQQITIA